MKPLKLTMTAFGPYKDTETVDFANFRTGLYLIAGDTGAGKTTIYDAVMFALFEETSNKPGGKDIEKGSVRDKTMVHSNYVDKSRTTIVELRFEEDGRTYTVTRTCKFSKKRGTKDQYSDARFDADLSDGASLSVTGSEKVTAQIKQIIGMDASQFRQIVMLAQGEFKAFVEARDNERKEILGKLFDSSSYAALMNALADAKKKLNDMADEQYRVRETALSEDAFPLPADMGEEERALYAPDHSDLSENIQRLIEKENGEIAAASKALEKAEKDLEALRYRRDTAKIQNEELEARDKLLTEQQKLKAQKEDMDALREAVKRAEKAVRAVHPKEEAAKNARNAAENAQRKLDEAKEQLAAARAEQEKAAEAAKENPQRTKQAQDFRDQATAIETTLADYDALTAAKSALQEAEKKLSAAEKKSFNAKQEEAVLEEKLAGIDAELLTLADADASAVRAQNNADAAAQLVTDLSGLTKKSKAITDADSRLKALLADWTKKKDAADKAEAEYRRLNDIFLSSQAAQLAKKLRVDIEQSGEAVCPVCGRRACADDTALFAVLFDEEVTEEQVKKAQKTSASARDLFDKANIALTEAAQKRNSDVESACREADRLLPENAPWTEEVLLDGTTLPKLAREKEEASRKAKDALAEAKEASNRKKKLEADRTAFAAEKQNASETVTEQEKIIAAQKEILNHQTKIRDDLAEKLTYENKDAAQKRVNELKAEAKKLDDAVTQAEKELNAANNAQSSANSTVEERDKNLQSARAASEEADKAFAAVLAENGFTDADLYRAALPEGEPSGYEAWLTQNGKTLTDYGNDVRNNAANLTAQQKKVKDYVRTEVTELQKQVEDDAKAVEDMRKSNTHREADRDQHQKALKKIEKARSEYTRISAAYNRVAALADVANGSKSDGGKHAFDGYVLGRSFREILQCSTMHLDIMTGGRYTLVHESSGRRSNAASDFVIQILDMNTGEQREIGSISGGEGFQVSMALALGLSDVAQAHVHGGKHIDAMFIDEGFGSLDPSALRNMVEALKNVSGGSRLIGVISHVDGLEEFIGDRITVKSRGEHKGSCITQD